MTEQELVIELTHIANIAELCKNEQESLEKIIDEWIQEEIFT